MDEIAAIAIERARVLYGVKHANAQPYSCSTTANQAGYAAALVPGEAVVAMSLAHGGHLSHGFLVKFSGRNHTCYHYGVRKESGRIDYGEVGSDLMVDMAYIAGLVAAGVHPFPFGLAEWVPTTTHKTLAGPRGGACFSRFSGASRLDRAVFPGLQGGPLEYVIAAKAVCFLLAGKEEFRVKQRLILENARVLAETLLEGGLRLVSGGTDNCLMLLDFRGTELTGKKAEEPLDRVGISANRNGVPGDERSFTITSGLRLGTAALTTRGFRPQGDAGDRPHHHPGAEQGVASKGSEGAAARWRPLSLSTSCFRIRQGGPSPATNPRLIEALSTGPLARKEHTDAGRGRTYERGKCP